MTITYRWRSEFSNEAVNRLHAQAFGHRLLQDNWWAQVNRHSLGWVCAYTGQELVGFVNVAWDGAVHAFILDTMVAANYQRQGVAAEMLAICAREARSARSRISSALVGLRATRNPSAVTPIFLDARLKWVIPINCLGCSNGASANNRFALSAALGCATAAGFGFLRALPASGT